MKILFSNRSVSPQDRPEDGRGTVRGPDGTAPSVKRYLSAKQLAGFSPGRLFTFGAAAASFVFGGLSTASAQQQFQGWCAETRIEIEQELALERIGFEATLEITNHDGEDAITDLFAELTFEDTDNGGEDASDLFFVQEPELRFVNSVDGDGVIQPANTAVITWFIIPKIDAGGTNPQGTQYLVGCNLGGKLGGEDIPEDNMLVIPETITVRPEPQLEITYFMPRDVQANNPFTETIESPVPFTLGVLVTNSGYGTARNLTIDSQQPRIVDNAQGLNLVAQLLGSRVMDSELDRASLLVDLGDIEPGETKKGAWDMITTLSGEFVDFNATYTHASELGGEETSVIKSLDAHFIVQEVINDQEGRDDILDFLTVTDESEDMIPDALYESEGNILPVNHLTQAEVVEDLEGDLEIVVGVNTDFEGWGYIRLDDPAQGSYEIEKVVRSDGKEIHPRNAWTSYRYEDPTNVRLDFVHIFDLVELGQYYEYTVEYQAPETDTDPPETEIHFSGEFTEDGDVVYVTRDTEIFFIAEDESPVSMYYKFAGDEDFSPAHPFSLSEPGSYTIVYYSEDAFGNVEEENVQEVVLSDAPPGFEVFDTAEAGLVQSGDTLSVRPSETDIGFTVGATPFDVEGDVDIFRGVVAWPRASGIPVSPTPRDDVSIEVGGAHVDYYRYRLNGGEWSEEAPVSESLNLSGLSGDVELEILGRSHYGDYLPEENAQFVEWTVSDSGYEFTLEGLPPIPMVEDHAEVFVDGPGLELYRWTLDESFFRAEESPSEPIELEGLSTGERVLDLVGRREGEWQSIDEPSRLRFDVDPGYGADLSELDKVRSIALGTVEDEVSLVWDGENDEGRPVPAGWYTVRVTLSDGLDRRSHMTRLVQVGDLASDAGLLAGAEDGPARPHARGNWAVWQDRVEDAWNIRARNLADPDGVSFAVTSGSRDQTHPVTDGRYVVWQGRRAGGARDVWISDLEENGSPVRLTDSSSTHAARPVIDAPWVVWREREVGDPDDPWQLVAHNLDTEDTFAVHPGPEEQGQADLRGAQLVWQDRRDVGVGEIYHADLETGEVRRLTESIDGQFHPAVSGHWVVWQDQRDGILEIYGYDFLRDAEVRLTDTPENERLPLLEGYWMITEEDGAGLDTGNFRLVNLEADRSAPLTNSPTEKAHPGLAAGHFVWEETLDGDTEIRVAELPALQAVFEDNNAVVVTPGLADRYDSAFALLEAWQEDAGIEAVGRYLSLVPEVERQTAEWDGGQATGEDFPIEQGDFLWVRFDDNRLVDLGAPHDEAIDLEAGVNSVAYGGFPAGFRVSALVDQLGEENVNAVRMLDSRNGLWKAVTIEEGTLVGPDYVIPETALLLVDMEEPVNGWKPE